RHAKVLQRAIELAIFFPIALLAGFDENRRFRLGNTKKCGLFESALDFARLERVAEAPHIPDQTKEFRVPVSLNVRENVWRAFAVNRRPKAICGGQKVGGQRAAV